MKLLLSILIIWYVLAFSVTAHANHVLAATGNMTITLYHDPTDAASVTGIGYDGIMTKPSLQLLYWYYNIYDAKYITLSSKGGDPIAAMTYGFWSFNDGIKVIVPKGAMCLSACAYFAIGSEELEINGILGFHQTRYESIDIYTPMITYGQNILRFNAEVLRYINDVGYSDQLTYDIFTQSTVNVLLTFTDVSQLDIYRHNNKNKIKLWPTMLINNKNVLLPFKRLTITGIDKYLSK